MKNKKLFPNQGKHEKRPKNELPSITRALIKTFGKTYAWGSFIKLFNDAAQFAGPAVMKGLIIFVRSQTSETPQPMFIGYLLAITMYVSVLIGGIAEGQYFQIVMTVGLQARGIMISKVFDHAMKLSSRGRKGRSQGKMVNLISSDAEVLAGTAQGLNTIWSAPLRIIVAVVLLYQELSWAALLGFSLLVISIPVQGRFVKYQSKYYKQTAKMTDQRLKHSQEAIASMNVIKMYAWQSSMGARINEARNNELKLLKSAKLLGAWNTVMISAVPITVTIVAFSTYALAIGDLTAEKAFTSIALFGVLRYPLIQLPQIITGLVGANVSLERLRDFLTADTVEQETETEKEEEEEEEEEEKKMTGAEGGTKKDEEVMISIDGNASFAWDVDSEDADMSNLNLNVKNGELLTVVGRTGSGKSSLLSVILNELSCLNTDNQKPITVVRGSIAYVPQESWIFNSTLRENILFGTPYNKIKYDNAVKVSCMESDFEQMAGKEEQEIYFFLKKNPDTNFSFFFLFSFFLSNIQMADGDMTEIGEKGVNLSGGQRQRVAIARAVYSDADIYLFDDPLSALDAKVARKIYDDCICDYLKKKTIILVTNRVEFVGNSDRVALMSNGKMSGIGTNSWMLENNKEFKHMMEGISDASTNDEEENEKQEEQKKKEKKEKEKKDKELSNKKKAATKDNDNDDKTTTAKKPKGQLIAKEHRDKGSIKWSVVSAYGRAMGGLYVLFGMLFLYMITEGVNVASTYWVSFWASDSFELGIGSSDYLGTYVGGYAGFSFAAIFLTLLSAYLQTYSSLAAAKSLHKNMIQSLLRAPMSFFHSTPLGRILNRFSKDQNDVDKTMEFAISLLIRGVVQLSSAFIVIGLATPYTLLAFVPVLFAFVYVQRYFQRTSRELKRMDAVSRSPVYAHFSECLNGLSSIRAYNKLQLMSNMNRIRLDNHLRINLASFSANRWLGIRMEVLGGFLIFASALFVVIGSAQIDPEQVGLQLSYAIRITGLLTLIVRILSLAENSFNSVERLREYTNVKSERSDESEFNQKPPSSWPDKGAIKFDNVVARYREDLDPVLTGLTFDVKKNEKIGIVGRTGAGKSSLFLTLFRIIERDEGMISIDGRDIDQMGLNDLRRSLAIIPQEPVLFSGTVRFNLDPFDEYDDSKLWFSLERVNLKQYVKSHGLGKSGLSMEVGEGGSNFSVGQRQLLCLARALLKGSKILVLDEATAAVDVETDNLIQTTIREAFVDCTTLTIAHRLNTIIDSDRVLVLDRGHVLEYDTPSVLLANKSSAFSDMVDETGKENASYLRAMANGEEVVLPSTISVHVASSVVGQGGDGEGEGATKGDGGGSSTNLRSRTASIGHLSRFDSTDQGSGGGGGGLENPNVLQVANNAIATLRDLVQIIGAGGTDEEKLRRDLENEGLEELSWLQLLHNQLVRLNIIIDNHTEELVQKQSIGEQDAAVLSGMLN